MKRLLFLLVLIPFLFGCETYFEESNSQLNLNGEWIISNIVATYRLDGNSDNNITIVDSNYYAQSPFTLVSVNNDGTILVRNDTTDIQPCFFYKIGYAWEFDYNTLIIKNNTGKILREYYIESQGQSFYNPNEYELRDKITGQSISGNWYFDYFANGSMPSNNLTITVPDLEFYFTGSGRSRDGMIRQSIILRFTR